MKLQNKELIKVQKKLKEKEQAIVHLKSDYEHVLSSQNHSQSEVAAEFMSFREKQTEMQKEIQTLKQDKRKAEDQVRQLGAKNEGWQKKAEREKQQADLASKKFEESRAKNE